VDEIPDLVSADEVNIKKSEKESSEQEFGDIKDYQSNSSIEDQDDEDEIKTTADFLKVLMSLSEGQRLALILIEANIKLLEMLAEEGFARCCDNYDSQDSEAAQLYAYRDLISIKFFDDLLAKEAFKQRRRFYVRDAVHLDRHKNEMRKKVVP
jgi:hypothetical protein